MIRKTTSFLLVILAILLSYIAYLFWFNSPYLGVGIKRPRNLPAFMPMPPPSPEQMTPEQRKKAVRNLLIRLKAPKTFEKWDAAVRNQYIIKLAGFKDPEVVEPLKKFLDQEEYTCAAAESLAIMGEKSVIPKFQEMAARSDKRSRCGKRALAYYKLPELESFYLQMLRDDDHDPEDYGDVAVRESAANALGGIKTEASWEALFGALQYDPEDSVRFNAGRSLADLKFPGTLERILDLIRKDPAAEHLRNYLQALKYFWDDESLAILKANLDLLIPFRWSFDEEVRKYAVDLTDRFKDGQNEDLFEPPSKARKAIAQAENAEINHLLGQLSDEKLDPYKRREAAETLSVKGVKEAIPVLIEYTKRGNIDDRRTGYSALARFDDPALIELFRECEKDRDQYIQFVCKQTRQLRAGLTAGEKAVSDIELIDLLFHPEKYPEGALAYRDFKSIDLNQKEVWIAILNGLEQSRARSDSAAIKRVFNFLETRGFDESGSGIRIMKPDEVKKLVPFLVLPDEGIRNLSLQLLIAKSGPEIADAIYRAFQAEQAEETKKILSMMLVAYLYKTGGSFDIKRDYLDVVFYIFQFLDLANDGGFSEFIKRMNDPVLTALLEPLNADERAILVEFGRSKMESIPLLITMTGSSSSILRTVAEEYLKKSDQNKVKNEAVAILAIPSSKDRFLAAKVLAKMGLSVIKDLESIRDKLDPQGQQFVAWIFREIGGEAGSAALGRMEAEALPAKEDGPKQTASKGSNLNQKTDQATKT